MDALEVLKDIRTYIVDQKERTPVEYSDRCEGRIAGYNQILDYIDVKIVEVVMQDK